MFSFESASFASSVTFILVNKSRKLMLEARIVLKVVFLIVSLANLPYFER